VPRFAEAQPESIESPFSASKQNRVLRVA
jgi:hypothetical protein